MAEKKQNKIEEPKKQEKEEKIDLKYNLREIWGFLKNYKGMFMFLLLIVFILEGLSLADKFLFKVIIDDGSNFIAGSLTKNAYINVLLIIGLIFMGLTITRAFGNWFKENLVQKLELNLIYDLKQKYFNHILNLSHSFHTTHKTGSLISRLTRGGHAIESIGDVVIYNFAPLIFQLIVVGISLAYFSITSLLVLLFVMALFFVSAMAILRLEQRYRIIYNKIEDKEKGFISDVFLNVDSIKYFGKERAVGAKYRIAANNTREGARKSWGYFRWFTAAQNLVVGFGLIALIYFPLKELLLGNISLGTLAFIYSVYGGMIMNLYSFVFGIRGFYSSITDIQELFNYSKIKNEVKDIEEAEGIKIRKGEIEFKDVTFHYGRKKAFSLEKFNLKIKENEKIAFVGHSGCGKTTLVKLLFRFYDPSSGNIFIDGKDIREVKQKRLRNELSIVPQECVLFDDSIYNNILFSNPSATRNEVMNAIKAAQLDKFVEKLPSKEDTVVGERGVKLSGGEKQRVSIARAILANKKILVLDEATSSLDSETESEIQKDLQNLLRGRTSIIIAHRLSTIMNADRIIVMKEGKIVEQGRHSELINQSGEYRKLWKLQKGGYIRE